MNTGYLVAALGVLGLVVGAAMYAMAWHKTIGLGGVGLGLVLVIVGIWYSRSSKPAAAPSAAQAATGS
jgi:hypothetical protein